MANSRKWRGERSVQTMDTLGEPVKVRTGLTLDAYGHLSVGIAIGDGPSAVVKLDHGSRLIVNLQDSLADLVARDGLR